MNIPVSLFGSIIGLMPNGMNIEDIHAIEEYMKIGVLHMSNSRCILNTTIFGKGNDKLLRSWSYSECGPILAKLKTLLTHYNTMQYAFQVQLQSLRWYFCMLKLEQMVSSQKEMKVNLTEILYHFHKEINIFKKYLKKKTFCSPSEPSPSLSHTYSSFLIAT